VFASVQERFRENHVALLDISKLESGAIKPEVTTSPLARYSPSCATSSPRSPHRKACSSRYSRALAWVRLEVLDTGIGIPPSALAHIYDEFYQVDVPADTAREGYGLGLSIVHRILNLLGHKLEVRSELGRAKCRPCRTMLDCASRANRSIR
jgi:signal transduction histidine kinase